MRLLLILLLASAALGIWAYPQLPERMATHFNASGEVNGWMSRTEFYVVYGATLLFISGMFAGLGRLMRILPPSMINLPHRNYWLAPERKQTTIRTIETSMLRLGAVTLLFLLYVEADVIRANLSSEPRIGILFWPVLILYLAVIAWFVVRMIRQFLHVPPGTP